jgi:hypothetical protein
MTLQSTMIHLERSQKEALQRRARQKGGSMASEIRIAIDRYLDDTNANDLALLDMVSKRVEKELAETNELMDKTIAALDRAFSKIEALRKRRNKA